MTGQTFPEWQHRFVSTRVHDGGKLKTTVTAGLHYLKGNRLPYFSVTTDTRRKTGNGRWVEDSGGCQHELVAQLWPKLRPIIALHLSDANGQPLHAEANGWYQLAGYYGGAGENFHAGNSKRHCPLPLDRRDPAKPWQDTEYRFPTPDECLASWAEYVRIPLDRARELADGWRDQVRHALETGGQGLRLKAYHAGWCHFQTGRWRTEADEGRALLDALIAAQADAPTL